MKRKGGEMIINESIYSKCRCTSARSSGYHDKKCPLWKCPNCESLRTRLSELEQENATLREKNELLDELAEEALALLMTEGKREEAMSILRRRAGMKGGENGD